jgi:hypothetical protein
MRSHDQKHVMSDSNKAMVRRLIDQLMNGGRIELDDNAQPHPTPAARD